MIRLFTTIRRLPVAAAAVAGILVTASPGHAGGKTPAVQIVGFEALPSDVLGGRCVSGAFVDAVGLPAGTSSYAYEIGCGVGTITSSGVKFTGKKPYFVGSFILNPGETCESSLAIQAYDRDGNLVAEDAAEGELTCPASAP